MRFVYLFYDNGYFDGNETLHEYIYTPQDW